MLRIVRGLSTSTIGIGCAYLLSIGCHEQQPRATVPANLGDPVEVPLALGENTRLTFTLHSESLEYRAPSFVVLDAQLLKNGASTASHKCHLAKLKGRGNLGRAHTSTGECSIVVPAGGASSLRLLITVEDPGVVVESKGLAVRVD